MNFLNKNYVVFFIIAIICLGVYANTFKNDFVFDDLELIVENSYIKSFKFLPLLLINNIYHFSDDKTSSYYRPIQMLTYFFDYSLWKLNPFGYHLTNIILHSITAYLLFILICILFQNRQAALFSSLLFAIHPISSTTVAYIASRADILAAIFIMLAIITFREYLAKEKNQFIILSISFYSLALLSRENAIVLPLLLLSFCILFKDKKKMILKYITPYALLIIFYIILRLQTDTVASSVIFRVKIPLKLWAINFLHIFAQYLVLIIYPAQLRIGRMTPFVSNINFSDLTIAFIFILLIIILIKKQDIVYRKQLLFLFLWLVITMIPIARLMFLYLSQKGLVMAENWLYLPAIGIFSFRKFI